MIRVMLPQHLQVLASCPREVQVDIFAKLSIVHAVYISG